MACDPDLMVNDHGHTERSENMERITINGTVYVPEASVRVMAPDLDGMEYCMV